MFRSVASWRVQLLLPLLIGCWLDSVAGSVCQMAVEFTRHVLLSHTTRTGAIVLPQLQLPAANGEIQWK